MAAVEDRDLDAKLSIMVTEEAYEDIKRLAAKRGVSISEWGRDAILDNLLFQLHREKEGDNG